MPIISGGGGGGGAVAALTWTSVTGGVGYTNGWADFGAPYGAVQYAKDTNFLYLRGGATPAGASADAMFTLPVAFRPATQRLFQVFDGAGGANTGAFEILTTGVVSAFNRVGATSFFFDGIVCPLT